MHTHDCLLACRVPSPTFLALSTDAYLSLTLFLFPPLSKMHYDVPRPFPSLFLPSLCFSLFSPRTYVYASLPFPKMPPIFGKRRLERSGEEFGLSEHASSTEPREGKPRDPLFMHDLFRKQFFLLWDAWAWRSRCDFPLTILVYVPVLSALLSYTRPLTSNLSTYSFSHARVVKSHK